MCRHALQPTFSRLPSRRDATAAAAAAAAGWGVVLWYRDYRQPPDDEIVQFYRWSPLNHAFGRLSAAQIGGRRRGLVGDRLP